MLVGLNALFGFMGLVYSSSATTLVCAVIGVVLCLWQMRQPTADAQTD